jgi:site-specific recombinase XerD
MIMASGDEVRHFYPAQTVEYADRAIEKAIAAGTLTRSDVSLIKEYVHERSAEKHLSIARVLKVIYTLISWRRFLPAEFRDLAMASVYEGIAAIKTGKNTRGTPFEANTIHDHIRILKQFLLWLNETGYATLPEKKIHAIQTPPVNSYTTEPDEILTHEEVLALINGAVSTRDRALIATLYESGCRIGELARLRWRDLVFDSYGVKMYIDDQKSRKRRYVRLAMAREALATYRNDYRGEPYGDSIVFISYQGEPMQYQAFARSLYRAAKRAKIEKKIKPHLFRKSRITHMIGLNYQESVIKQAMWGNLDTKMMKTYLVQSENDIDAEFLEKAGVRQKKDVIKPVGPIPCPECHTINGPTASFCSHCGRALSEEAIQDVRETQTKIEDHPLFKQAMAAAEARIRAELNPLL